MFRESRLKEDDDLLTIRIDSDGPMRGLTVTADRNGHVKGYPNRNAVLVPNRADGHLDVGSAVGKGTLTVIRDLGLKDPYVGTIDLQSGEIAEDLTYYFAVSEQIPSSVGLGVLVGGDKSVLQAGGFLLQLMPFALEETISRLEQNIRRAPAVTELLREGLSPEDMPPHTGRIDSAAGRSGTRKKNRLYGRAGRRRRGRIGRYGKAVMP